VQVIPRVHGSAIFQRGETQILGVTTLNMLKMEQQIDSLSPTTSKRYMHHYNFPPYSTGETGRVGSPKRREIGHGFLAERALVPVLPSREEFPYAIRQVSEALSSNGSTSMGSVCASTLSLLNAGVPLRAPVAGIAMGLKGSEAANRLAAAIAKGARTAAPRKFLLEMGEPVKIADLARQMILLSGKSPDSEITISYCGLRAGEKLSEILLDVDEKSRSCVDGINEIISPRHGSTDSAMEEILSLIEAARSGGESRTASILNVVLAGAIGRPSTL
jgi:hypothetical protein